MMFCAVFVLPCAQCWPSRVGGSGDRRDGLRCHRVDIEACVRNDASHLDYGSCRCTVDVEPYVYNNASHFYNNASHLDSGSCH